MEENINLTAERSLEIITEQIARNRKDVSKSVGISLYVAGLCTMAIAILIGLGFYFTCNGMFYLLYLALPLIIWGISRYAKRNEKPVPSSFIGTMVKNTWNTFAIFAIAFFVFANLFDILMLHTENLEVYSRMVISPFRIILLLMGMCVTITGYILKNRWLVWCGIIGGLGGFFWEAFGVTSTLFVRFGGSLNNYCGVTQGLVPGIIIAIFAFVGLTLPGLMLKRQKQ